MRRLIVFSLLALVACSPAQERAWLRWFHREPRAAVDWAVDECGTLCSDDWDRDGLVEPEPEAGVVAAPSETTSADWTDGTVTEADADVGWGECSQWMGDALAAGWTSEQWATLNWIMARESNCDPGAYNPSGARGLLQVMGDWADNCGGSPDDLFQPWFNLSCGLYVYSQQGWSAWSVW